MRSTIARSRYIAQISDSGFDDIFANAAALVDEPIVFRTLAIEFCDQMADLAPDGVHWHVGDRKISAVVDEQCQLSDTELAHQWDKTLQTVDLPGMALRARVSVQPAPVVPGTMTDAHYAWATAALSDGWKIQLGGPWARQIPGGPHDPETKQIVVRDYGYDSDDHSVVLRKDDAVVWFVNRITGSTARPASYRHEVWTAGWFSNGLRAFVVPEVYDKRLLAALRGVCLECDKYVGETEIEHVGFAGAYCHDCAPAQRKKQEFPGWCD